MGRTPDLGVTVGDETFKGFPDEEPLAGEGRQPVGKVDQQVQQDVGQQLLQPRTVVQPNHIPTPGFHTL